ncbi:class I SAM-dependent methyltransferase [Lawsonia intracellularis]|uniref:class I SAM-dependent methyltransferase n=1 Tax=Lawsonia intracellularis TaxID=29546 RepID=UPI0021E52CFC|nr:class I SAM-dependent methyltransferase [Lawsonia intracellularis]UYH53686.1 class I SAM-dependent methyltransferase [Lawsonia intracellularis]
MLGFSPHTLPGHEDNAIWNNTKLGQLAQRKYSTTAWETDFLEQLLPSLITSHNLCIDIPFIDVGCGDGRITYLLHRVGFNKLVGIDLDEINVRNAASQTPSSSLNNIVFMTGDALSLPFKHNTLQQIFISGLPSLSNVFLNIYPFLTDSSMGGGGILLCLTATALEAALIYALTRGDWKEFIHIIETQTRAASWENKNIRYPITIVEDVINEAKQAGFSLEAKYGIPIFASLVFGALCQQQTLNEDDKELLYNILYTIPSINLHFMRQSLLIFRKQ